MIDTPTDPLDLYVYVHERRRELLTRLYKITDYENPMPPHPWDVMGGASRWEIKVLDKGFIALIDFMPRLVKPGLTADSAIPQAARVSYGLGTKQVSQDLGLLNYLKRHRHTTPFEMVEAKFHVRLPIFVARQWIRHRTASVNEYSGRYSIMPDDRYIPEYETVRTQSESNRQGGEEIANAELILAYIDYLENLEQNHRIYKDLVDRGLSREQARIGLPMSIYTQWYWKCDLHNIMHFLGLRMDAHAQWEMRQYAYAMFTLLYELVPQSMEALLKYELCSVRLSLDEVAAIKGAAPFPAGNQRAIDEFTAKRNTLGL